MAGDLVVRLRRRAVQIDAYAEGLDALMLEAADALDDQARQMTEIQWRIREALAAIERVELSGWLVDP